MPMTILRRAAAAAARILSRDTARARPLAALRDASDEILADLGLAAAPGRDLSTALAHARSRFRPI